METANTSALLSLNLPQAALAGIDLLSFTTTPRFRGVKGLPPGFHFTYVGSSIAFSERHGVWFQVTEQTPAGSAPLFITRWDTTSETLQAITDDAHHLRWRANLGSIWREGLTPYRQSATATEFTGEEEPVNWPNLTSHITSTLLFRITGNDWSLSSASSAKRDLEDIPGLKTEDMPHHTIKDLNFLPVELKQTWREGATGRERTDAAKDRSWAFHNLTQHHCTSGDAMEIVGELQFCFLMILTLNNFSCLEQWKRILTLVFTCRSAAERESEIFVHAIRSLSLQLQHCRLADSGLIDLADEGGSMLKGLLVRFRKGLQGLGGVGVQEVVDGLDELEDYLRAEHGWQFGGSFVKSGVLELEDGEQVRMDTTAFDEDDETGEYAPQVVDLTPEQARLLGVAAVEELHVSMGGASIHQAESDDGDDDESKAAEDLEDMDARY